MPVMASLNQSSASSRQRISHFFRMHLKLALFILRDGTPTSSGALACDRAAPACPFTRMGERANVRFAPSQLGSVLGIASYCRMMECLFLTRGYRPRRCALL